MATLESLIKEVRTIKDYSSSRAFENLFDKNEKDVLSTITDKDWKTVREFIFACLEVGNSNATECVVKLLEKRKLINWKTHTEIFDGMFSRILEHGMKPDDGDILRMADYSSTTDKLINLLKALQLMGKYENSMFMMVSQAISTPDNRLHLPSINCVNAIKWEKHKDWIKQLMQKSTEVVRGNPDMSEKHNLAMIINHVWMMMFQSMAQNPRLAANLVKDVAPVFEFCADQEWVDMDDSDIHTLSHQMCANIMQSYLIYHKEKEQIIKPLFPTVKKLWKCEDEELQRDANNIITSLGANASEILGDDIDILIELYVSGEEPMLITQFGNMYPGCPEKFHPYVDRIAEAMVGGEDWVYSTTLVLFWEIAKNSPQSFSKDSIKYLVDSLKIPTCRGVAMMPLGSLAEKRPHDVVMYDDILIKHMLADSTVASQGGQALVQLASVSEKHAAKYLNALRQMLEKSTAMFSTGLVYYMRTIGAANPSVLEPHKTFFEGLLKDPGLKEHAQNLLDLIEGRTLKNISKDVEGQKEDIEQLDTRVTTTENQVEELDKDIKITKQDVSELREDVDAQEIRITEVEYVADETADKVQEIDKKTLSHAPTWSRDVSRFMNEEAEHDWRLLAGRLGYNNDDIRNWATQPDPCLTLLDEWFATHKTRDATFAVLQALQEMNRGDAAMIVENALKAAEGVVEDEDEDTGPPPPVFISYQWGHQDEAKLLKKHLEMAGYPCWMDIGQMGGGDKLFAKIDSGIRAAKVVICCVTDKYAASPNCNREVNLSVTLGKPIIPLLMEKMSWPPPGSMGPIFGEYLFIRFFARSGETAGDERYWPTAKCTELLMQIRFSVAPNHDMIKSEYDNWWSPPEEVIVIKPRDEKPEAKTGPTKDKKSEVASSPQVFISYQWGKQPQIKALFRRLTQEGYSCWLDIMQMGGGDSLYDKIDKGVRGCDVVISCVTSKYSLSANCRREVSLADALKKPIIPILLEQITWPPEGPMSMVFTQLLYIDFSKPNVKVQEDWNCKQFQELLGKLNGYLAGCDKSIEPVLHINNSDSQNRESLQNIQKEPSPKQEEKQEKDKASTKEKKSGVCQLL